MSIGDTINSLTIISEPYSVFHAGKKRKFVDCICVCGVKKTIIQASIKSGRTKSCGCISLEFKDRLKAKKMRRSFNAMHRRCNEQDGAHFKYYKQKGIMVCDEWNDFKVFYNDMESTWQMGLELDRRNGNEGYNKWNCRWVTSFVQQTNKSNTKLNEQKVNEIRYSNLSQNELAHIYGVKQNTISRIKNNKRWATI